MNLLHDLDQTVGRDLSASGTGDLLTASGIQRSQQRVLRRLLTPPGDYLFHPAYGAGLPKWIGQTADIPCLRSLIRAQLRKEASVAHYPEPSIKITPMTEGMAIAIHYMALLTKRNSRVRIRNDGPFARCGNDQARTDLSKGHRLTSKGSVPWGL